MKNNKEIVEVMATAMDFLLSSNKVIRVAGVYAHGKAEELCDTHNTKKDFTPPDLIGLAGEFPLLADGKHSCTVHAEPATLFYWRGGVMGHRGLVVLNTDTRSLAHAKAKLRARPAML